MTEIDGHFNAYEHLKHLPREAEALHTLRKAASVVKPIMRKRAWKVNTLCEFLPPDPCLLGLNMNKTERIFVRLRYGPDPKQFFPFEQVVDTLLHELSHIVFGPHDGKFHALWNELRSEHRVLLSKGYTGEGFLAKGRKLGGHRVPLDEMRRQARIAAEKRHREKKKKSSGQKLGGKKAPYGADVRKIIADAAAQRTKITKGCASGTREGAKAAEEAKRNGFRTKAEQDDANDLAIAKALVELMEEDETRKLEGSASDHYDGGDEIEGLKLVPERGLKHAANLQPSPSTSPEHKIILPENPKSHLQSKSSQSSQSSSSKLKVFDLLAEAERKRQGRRNSMISAVPSSSKNTVGDYGQPSTLADQNQNVSDCWTCSICTLNNPTLFLCCDACGTERPDMLSAFSEID